MSDTNIDLTAITTPLCLLDERTQAALKAHGGPYEYLDCEGAWAETLFPSWSRSLVYRVKPGPKRETVPCSIVPTTFGPKFAFIHATIDLIDGKPDPTSVKPDGE